MSLDKRSALLPTARPMPVRPMIRGSWRGAAVSASLSRARVTALPILMVLPILASIVLGVLAAQAETSPELSFDAGIERYRGKLVQDIDQTVANVRKLRSSLDSNDVAAAKRAWIDARVGWERSEVFTAGFAPELDRDIDAWPNGLVGFHAIEAKLFGADRTDVGDETDLLLQNLLKLSATVHDAPLTPQGLFNGVARLAYEVGGSKLDGGESRLSGTSIDDMRNNVDGIDLAYGMIFASAVGQRDHEANARARRQIDELKAMLEAQDLRRIDPERLRNVSEELILTLQGAAPRLALERPTLE